MENRAEWNLSAFCGLPPKLPLNLENLDASKSSILMFELNLKCENYDSVKEEVEDSFKWISNLFFQPDFQVEMKVFPSEDSTKVTVLFLGGGEKAPDPISFLSKKKRKNGWDFLRAVYCNGTTIYPLYRLEKSLFRLHNF